MSTHSGKIVLWGVLATVGIYLLTLTLPLFGILLSVLAPLPILLSRIICGRVCAFLLFGISAIIVLPVLYLLEGAVNLQLFLQLGVTGLIMGEVWGRGYSLDKTVAYSVIPSVAASVVLLLVTAIWHGLGPAKILEEDITSNVEYTLRVYQSMGIPVEQSNHLPEIAKRLSTLLLHILPALTVVGLTILVWANLIIGDKLIVARKLGTQRWMDLKKWKAPEQLVWVPIISGFGALFAPSYARIAAVNFLMIATLVYFFQGLSITAFYLDRKNVPRFFRIFIYALISIQQFLTLLVIALGLFDTWFDFRKLNKQAV